MRSKTWSPTKALATPYWREADARAALAAWARSRQSLAAFAREHSIPIAKLHRWKRRLGESRPLVLFHPVRVRRVSDGEGAPQPAAGLELVVAGGRRILVQRGFDRELLEELVRVVESWPC